MVDGVNGLVRGLYSLSCSAEFIENPPNDALDLGLLNAVSKVAGVMFNVVDGPQNFDGMSLLPASISTNNQHTSLMSIRVSTLASATKKTAQDNSKPCSVKHLAVDAMQPINPKGSDTWVSRFQLLPRHQCG
jgi:hypothetical protein